jgi:quinolinate synthase
VQGGVHFMAETSKLLCPGKMVLIPDTKAGCSLAESITGADVRAMREKYPGRPVVAYVNTSADVKAEVDICCTSSNAVRVVESLNAPEVIFLPDRFLAANVATQTKVKIIPWHGACEVHERFTPEEIREFRTAHPGLEVIGHPECPPEVIAECDFSGSTAGMINYVKQRKPKKVLMVTECTMSDNVATETPDVEFIRPCNFCPHMRRITLPGILNSLTHLTYEVTIDPTLAARAVKSVQRMIDLK